MPLNIVNIKYGFKSTNSSWYQYISEITHMFIFSQVIGRTNPPGMADLVLYARTAHQDGPVGNSPEFRHPDCFYRGKRCGAAFLVTFLAVD